MEIEGQGLEDVGRGVVGIERDGLVGLFGGGLGKGGSGLRLGRLGLGPGEELGSEDEVALGLGCGFVAVGSELGEGFLGDVVHQEEHEDGNEY